MNNDPIQFRRSHLTALIEHAEYFLDDMYEPEGNPDTEMDPTYAASLKALSEAVAAGKARLSVRRDCRCEERRA